MHIFAPEHLEIGFVLSCAAIVFLMQAGFCLLESGLVRSKNAINVAVKNVLDCSLAMLLFVGFGGTIMFGVSQGGWFGMPFSVDFFSDPKLLTFLLFQLVFCSTATTIVSGAIAERARLVTYMIIVVLISVVIYPVFGHWAWGGMLRGTEQGWLAQLGFVDWAGGSVVHIIGGFAALAAVQVIGKRRNLSDKSLTGGYSLTLAILGCFLLWFGWWGFNGGSGLAITDSLPKVILNTNISAVAGGLMAAICTWLLSKQVRVVPLITGVLAGLVAITPCCHAVAAHSAFLIGSVGSGLALLSSALMVKLNIDDAVGAFQVHGVSGCWGIIAFALFAPESELLVDSRWTQIGIQSLGAFAAAAFSYLSVLGVLNLVSLFMPLRVSEEEERIGLNVVEHGATNEVTDLLVEINKHSQTGDFSTDIAADAHTEVGQIATQYNQVISRVRTEIADREQTSAWLESERLRMKSVLDHAGVGIYQLTPDGVINSANSTLLELLGFQSLTDVVAAQNENKDCLLPWHTSDDESPDVMGDAFARGSDIKELESNILSVQGKQTWVLESLVPVREQDGNLLCWLGTVHDISKQKLATLAEIEIAKAKSDAKGEFLASMSHEIRTPLNGVIGMLDLLDTSSLQPKEQNFVSIAKTSAGSLLSLINDILDFSKIESGHMELEKIKFDVRELIEQTAEQFAYHAHVKQLEMNCQVANDLPYLLVGDPERLRQVMVNLLSNAIKFTETGEVNLTATRRGNVMRIGIQDTGIGMNAATQEKLFQSFTQADASTTRKYGGTGLGLAISWQLIDLMGGRINVESTLGKGTEFWFEIAMEVAEENPHSEEETQNLLSRLPNTRVLVVDDNSTNCEILANQFNNWGLDVSVCKDSTAAVDRMLIAVRIGKPFDLLILDYCMPVMNGREVATAMQKHPELAGIQTILLSSNYELLSAKDMETIGIEAAITKPARQSRLLDTVMSLLHSKFRISPDPNAEPPRTSIPELVDPTVDRSYGNTIPTSAQQRENDRRLGVQEDFRNDPSPNAAREGTVTVFENHSSPIVFEEQLADTSMCATGSGESAADVLIVEDNYVNRIVAQKMVSELGLTSDFASDGHEGVERVKNADYKLVLMDGHMPVMDGLTATREIRRWESQQGNSKRVPIVALTANVVQGIRQECREAGMDDYLCKPITIVRIRRIIEKYVTNTRREDPRDIKSSSENSSPPIANVIEASSQSSAEPCQASPEKPKPGPGQIFSQPIPDVSRRVQSVSQSTPQRPQEPLVDQGSPEYDETLIQIEKLKQQCCGDDDFALQILQIMHDTLPGQIQELEAANSRLDFDHVAQLAHQVKGAAADSCLALVCESAASVEASARNQEAQQLQKRFEVMRQRVFATIESIELLLDTQN